MKKTALIRSTGLTSKWKVNSKNVWTFPGIKYFFGRKVGLWKEWAKLALSKFSLRREILTSE
jgi:hypothetical protein